MDVGELSRQLASRAEEIAMHLLPSGKRIGQEWCAGSVDGEKGKSLKVHLTGNKAGVFKDFASGEGGDLVGLWMASKGLSIRDAIREIKDYLGIIEPQFEGARNKSYKKPEKPNCRRLTPDSPIQQYLLAERYLSLETIYDFQVAEMFDNQGGIIVFPFKREGELINIKFLRKDRDEKGKKKSWFAEGCEPCLFGWQALDKATRSVVICEGEIDAMTWHQYGIPALSVPNGSKGTTWIPQEFENLERFETLYISFDMDDAGRKGIGELIDRLGRHRCRIVRLPFKDANECLQRGVEQAEMQKAIQTSETCDPNELRRAGSYVEDVIESFYPKNERELGFLTPWSRLHGSLRFRPGELSLWTGFNHHGKTTLLSHLMISAMKQGERVCVASLEAKPKMTLKKMTIQLTATKLPSIEHIRQVHSWYDDKLWIFDLVGSAKVKRLFEVWLYARQRYGINQFVLDSLMRCGIDEDNYNEQKQLVDRLAEFATTHNVHIHLVAHARKKENDKASPTRMDIKGTGTISDLAHNCFAVWRNTEKSEQINNAMTNGTNIGDIINEPCAYLKCDKQREGEWIGSFPLWFDGTSLQYLQVESDAPIVYVPFLSEEDLLEASKYEEYEL